MRLKAVLIGWGLLLLLLAGLRPDALPFIRQDALYSDAVLSHWPNAAFLSISILEHSQLPLWRETIMAGQPFAANPLNKTAYPLQWLVLALPPALHLNLMIVLHMLLAGLGLYRWARLLGLRMEASTFSAVTYALAPRLLGHLAAGHLDIVYAMGWWPWLMAIVYLVMTQDKRRGTRTILLALFAALVLTADLRVGLFALSSAAVYALLLLTHSRDGRRLFPLVTSGLIAFLLTLALLIPLVLWQPFTSRAWLSTAEASGIAFNPGHFIGVLLPIQRSDVENQTYLGLPVLLLGIIGIMSFHLRYRLLAVGLVIFIALYGLGTNAFLYPFLVDLLIPGLTIFRVPSRIWLVLALLMPLWAGFGLNWLWGRIDVLRSSGEWPALPRLRLTLAAWILLCLLFGLFLMIALPTPLTGIGLLLLGGLTGMVLLVGASRRLSALPVVLLLIGLASVDVAATGLNWVQWRGPDEWLDPYRALAERLVAEDADRVYSPTLSLPQQVAETYHLRLFGGVDPFQLSGIVRAVEQGSGVPVTRYEVVLPPLTGIESDADIPSANRDAVIDTAVLGQWQVSHVVAAYPIYHPRLQSVAVINSIFIYSNRDYRSSLTPGQIPDWPADWPGLPTAEDVSRFNQITGWTSIISGTAWIIAVAALLVLLRRSQWRV